MNKQRDTLIKGAPAKDTRTKGTPAKAPRSDARDASGQHHGLRHPVDDDQRVEQRLDDVGLEDQGDVAEDQLRDRRSSGKASEDRSEGNRDIQRH